MYQKNTLFELAYHRRSAYCRMKSDHPFRYLTSEEFLALPEAGRVAYLQKVTDHLNVRSASLIEPPPPQKKIS